MESSVFEAYSGERPLFATLLATSPIAERRVESVSNAPTASVKSFILPSLVKLPVFPSRKICPTPLEFPALTGSPAAWASNDAKRCC